MSYLAALKRLHAQGCYKFIGGHRDKLHGTDVCMYLLMSLNGFLLWDNNQEKSV